MKICRVAAKETGKSVDVRIVCVIPSLGNGGAQKVIVQVADHLSKSGACDVRMLIFEETSNSFYTPDLYPVESIHTLGSKFNPIALMLTPFRLLKYFRKQSPDLIISFMDIANFPTLLAGIFLRQTKIIVSERQDPQCYNYRRVRRFLRVLTYPLAWKIVVQTEHIEKQMPYSLAEKICVIPNPVEIKKLKETNFNVTGHKVIILVGRLEKQKGYEIFLEAVSKLRENFHGWSVCIYGAGSLENSLLGQIKYFQLEDIVRLCGVTTRLSVQMEKAQIFVLPSINEGFSNALAEAVAVGLPVIAFKGVGGVKELIEDDVNGFVVSDRSADKLASAIRALMVDENKRRSMGKNSYVVAQKYDRRSVLAVWERLVLCAVNNDG